MISLVVLYHISTPLAVAWSLYTSVKLTLSAGNVTNQQRFAYKSAQEMQTGIQIIIILLLKKHSETAQLEKELNINISISHVSGNVISFTTDTVTLLSIKRVSRNQTSLNNLSSQPSIVILSRNQTSLNNLSSQPSIVIFIHTVLSCREVNTGTGSTVFVIIEPHVERIVCEWRQRQ
jgi:hypothetical protein